MNPKFVEFVRTQIALAQADATIAGRDCDLPSELQDFFGCAAEAHEFLTRRTEYAMSIFSESMTSNRVPCATDCSFSLYYLRGLEAELATMDAKTSTVDSISCPPYVFASVRVCSKASVRLFYNASFFVKAFETTRRHPAFP